MSTDSAYWTIAVFFLTWGSVWLPLAIFVSWRIAWRPPQPLTPAQKLPLLASLYALAPVVIWGMCWLRQESFRRYGLVFTPALGGSLVWGLLGGTFGLGVLFWLQQRLGWLQWNSLVSPPPESSTAANLLATLLSVSLWRTLLATLLLGLWVSFTEELVFRGFIQTQLEQPLTPWQAALLTSGLFALLHLVWEGRANLPQLPGLALMGIVLTLARWVDHGHLGLAWGLHAGWVWLIVSLDTLKVVHYTGHVSPWWTGWDGKPLAGALGIGFLLLTAGVLWAIGNG